MGLITKALANRIPPMRTFADAEIHDVIITAKFFANGTRAKWLVAEYDPTEQIIFCYVDLYGGGRWMGAEWGYSSVEELEDLRLDGLPRVLNDENFTPRKFLECVDREGR